MLPDPLHPALVHFPIVLAVLLPIVGVAVLWALRTGIVRARAWGIFVTLAAALVLASWLAVQTGERQEERVEEVVAESALESHEEAAELFLLLTLTVLVTAGIGITPGAVGRSARIVSVALAVAALGAGWKVGHSGGELVYRYGAAQAYASGIGVETPPRADLSAEDRSLDDDHDD